MISCICCHYGRTWLLAEAVESYLRQEFSKDSELIIVNDHPEITISVDTSRLAPNQSIRIANLPARMPTLSDKFDLGATMANGDLICMWDDDDLSLPWRLEHTDQLWRFYHQLENASYLAFDRHIYVDTKGPHMIARGIHGGDVVSRACYWRVGGSTGAGHNDQNLVARVKEADEYFAVTPSKPWYVYRWSNIGSHHSSRLALADAMAEFDQRVRRDPRFRVGELLIEPGYSPATERLVAQCCKMAEDHAIGWFRMDENKEGK